MSRDRVLERVRAALAVPARTATAHGASPHGAPPAGAAVRGTPPGPIDRAGPGPSDARPAGDPVALFVERSRQVGATVERVTSLAEAAARVAALCKERGARTAAAWEAPALVGVLAAVRDAGLTVLAADAEPAAVAAAEVGITGADWGIAESGTLVLASGPGRPRLASLLPAVHMAILPAGHVLPDLAALFARTGDLPSALTFITGPSRSADIGFTPVLGAHGPTEVVVLVVEGWAAAGPAAPEPLVSDPDGFGIRSSGSCGETGV